MRRMLLAIVPAAALLVAPVAAMADGMGAGAATGAVSGAVVGGPVGAVAGLVIGAVVGSTLDPPAPAVREYVVEHEVPPIQLQGNLVVGAQLPSQIEVYPVPEDPRYAYAVINGHYVIVDPQTYVVVQIVS